MRQVAAKVEESILILLPCPIACSIVRSNHKQGHHRCIHNRCAMGTGSKFNTPEHVEGERMHMGVLRDRGFLLNNQTVKPR